MAPPPLHPRTTLTVQPSGTPRAVEFSLLAFLGVGAFVVRASPYFRETGVLGWAVDSDEGVYLSAAALLWRGALPYRDFVFVHPPGILYALAPLAWLDVVPSRMLELARWGIAALGAVNVVLAARIINRRAGLLGGCVTAGLLAVWPEVVANDRGVHLEPFLTAAVLLAVAKLDAASERPLTAGVFFGLALWVKSWAVLWLVGWLLARGRRAVPGIVVAGVVGALGTLPWLFLAPDLLTQLIGVHLWRPPDGDAGLGLRLREMFASAQPCHSGSWPRVRRRCGICARTT